MSPELDRTGREVNAVAADYLAELKDWCRDLGIPFSQPHEGIALFFVKKLSLMKKELRQLRACIIIDGVNAVKLAAEDRKFTISDRTFYDIFARHWGIAGNTPDRWEQLLHDQKAMWGKIFTELRETFALEKR